MRTPSRSAGHPAPGARPLPPGQRVYTLDVLRGFALLGILLVNVELFRGPFVWDLLAGRVPAATGGDRVAQFVVGWLVSGKFLSSFALLFGIGAAVISVRALQTGRSPRRLLARRYAWLIVFGLVHMLLLFSGDILFAYGLAGLLLIPFVSVRPRTALWWAGGIVGVLALLTLLVPALVAVFPQQSAPGPTTSALTTLVEQRRGATVTAYTSGGLGQQIQARAWEALFVQVGTLLALPRVFALFLVGFALGKLRIVTALQSWLPRLRTAAVWGLAGGLLLNLPTGFAGPQTAAVGAAGPGQAAWALPAREIAQLLGEPLLAIGYLAGLALLCQRPAITRALRPLADAGRMALTGYILQSVLATGFFVWLSYYGQLTTAGALGVVAVIWVVMLGFCVLWQVRFDRGPLEALWRRLTYGPPRH